MAGDADAGGGYLPLLAMQPGTALLLISLLWFVLRGHQQGAQKSSKRFLIVVASLLLGSEVSCRCQVPKCVLCS